MTRDLAGCAKSFAYHLKPALSSMIGMSHIWVFKLSKIKNSVPQSPQLHFRCSVAAWLVVAMLDMAAVTERSLGLLLQTLRSLGGFKQRREKAAFSFQKCHTQVCRVLWNTGTSAMGQMSQLDHANTGSVHEKGKKGHIEETLEWQNLVTPVVQTSGLSLSDFCNLSKAAGESAAGIGQQTWTSRLSPPELLPCYTTKRVSLITCKKCLLFHLKSLLFKDYFI